MTVIDAIKKRFSVRTYHNEPVDESVLSCILEAAQYAQSAKNLQDWRFIVIRDQEKRSELSIAAKNQSFVAEAPVIIVCCGVGTDYIMTCGQHSYPIDVAIAMENMALTAHEAGLGTCWIGAFYEERVKELLSIPKEGVRVVGMLTIGYPAVPSPQKRRKKIEDIVNYECWKDISE